MHAVHSGSADHNAMPGLHPEGPKDRNGTRCDAHSRDTEAERRHILETGIGDQQAG